MYTNFIDPLSDEPLVTYFSPEEIETEKSISMWTLIFGILSIVLGPVFSILGIIFGMRHMESECRTHSKKAVAGLIISVITLFFSGIVIFYLLAAISDIPYFIIRLMR